MNPEMNPMDPALERAVSEIREEVPGPPVVEAAAARVWARLSEAAQPQLVWHIRSCADFQSLIPDFKAGRLSGARALLLQDHLHECVACRHVFEGKVVTLPAPRTSRRLPQSARWAVAAVVVAAAGLSVWVAVDQYGGRTGRAIVQTVNGTLYEVSASGIRPLTAGQALPDGVEIRTAKDSDAMLQLRDGSVVELRERSGFSTSESGKDLTIRLERGSIIVQAAKRRSSHLYVATADCRVSVTGTVFSVSAGAKGSRVSVVQGEVRVVQDNQEKVLHPGDQSVSSPIIEPMSVRDDISWSRNRERYFALLGQLAALRSGLDQIHLPQLRYSSKLLGRLPADTVFFASIPNLAAYLGEAQTVFRQRLADSPELRGLWQRRGLSVEPMLENLRAASEYLGDEIAVVGVAGHNGDPLPPAFLAEAQRAGFPEFLKEFAQKQGLPVTVETRNGLVVFGPAREAVEALAPVMDSPSGGFAGTPFYARIQQVYRGGAGLMLCADLSRIHGDQAIAGARYFIAEQKEVDHQMETRAALGFAGPRTGMAAWLASPAPMGSLEYVSPDATFVAAFVVNNPSAIVDEVSGVVRRTPADLGADAADVHSGLAASLGGEFALALDGPTFPVPSWKLVTEVYDPARLQATLMKMVEAYSREAAKSGGRPLRTSRETVDGRTYYTIAGGVPNPLTEAHYTFADGYFIAGPSRALIARALQVKAAGTSIVRSTKFVSMTPSDQHTNFSGVVYQGLGTTLAPLAGLLGAFGGNMTQGQDMGRALQGLGNLKPTLLAAYGDPDQITVASIGNVLSGSITGLLSGNVMGMAGNVVPFAHFQGTRRPQPAFR